MDIPSPSNGRPIDPAVEAELKQLGSLPIANLRIRYRELFRTDPPLPFGLDLLRRSIAQQAQEETYGGLSREAKKLLVQLVRSMASRKTSRLEVPQRIKPGSELVRVWNDQTHRVTVLDKGFAYQGEIFTSLSEIANRITGTRWNGPKFFGLRATTKAAAKVVAMKTVLRGARRGRK